jgi:chromosome segregation ATPase
MPTYDLSPCERRIYVPETDEQHKCQDGYYTTPEERALGNISQILRFRCQEILSLRSIIDDMKKQQPITQQQYDEVVRQRDGLRMEFKKSQDEKDQLVTDLYNLLNMRTMRHKDEEDLTYSKELVQSIKMEIKKLQGTIEDLESGIATIKYNLRSLGF